MAIRSFDSFCEIYPKLVADKKLLLCYLPTLNNKCMDKDWKEKFEQLIKDYKIGFIVSLVNQDDKEIITNFIQNLLEEKTTKSFMEGYKYRDVEVKEYVEELKQCQRCFTMKHLVNNVVCIRCFENMYFPSHHEASPKVEEWELEAILNEKNDTKSTK